jgi:hypothetical protein
LNETQIGDSQRLKSLNLYGEHIWSENAGAIIHH